jgi:hypothetical protein
MEIEGDIAWDGRNHLTNNPTAPGTNVTLRHLRFCYTAINAFATVCSLSGDPVGSAPPPPLLPAVRSSANFIASGNANSRYLFKFSVASS